jgi:hypothetical protein
MGKDMPRAGDLDVAVERVLNRIPGSGLFFEIRFPWKFKLHVPPSE